MKTIVFVRIIRPGGIDGMDHKNKGGPVEAFLDEKEAEKSRCAWSDIKAEIHDLEEVFKTTLKNLTPVQRLALEQHYEKLPKIRSKG